MISSEMIGKKVLVTTDNWFYGPDGYSYRGVYGTLNAILEDNQLLGVQTNRHSTNWYLSVGDVLIAGCQIHYCVVTDSFDETPPKFTVESDGKQSIHSSIKSNVLITK